MGRPSSGRKEVRHMPNNLVFNDSAENLKVQSFGATSGGTVTSLLVANDGALQVGGTITAAIADTVTVTGAVSVTANSFDIRALSSATDTVSVAGSVTATIANTVTVSVGGYGFTSSDLNIALTDVSLTNTAFSFDTSQMKQYSFYVVNTGTAAISVRLQVSPTTSETYFVPDNTSEVALTQNQAAVLVPGYFLNYTRVQVLGAQTATAVAYFNGQN